MKNTGKSLKFGSNKSAGGQEVKMDRKSSSGMSGSPKKGGRGGKFTWSGYGLYEVESVAAVGANDPNFEDLDNDVEVVVAGAGNA